MKSRSKTQMSDLRSIDELGRLVLPKQIRDLLQWRINDTIEITADKSREKVTLVKAKLDTCYFCGSASHLKLFRGTVFCRDCLLEIADMMEPFRDLPADETPLAP